MILLSVSDWCGLASLLAAVIIGVLQICQNMRSAVYERDRQDSEFDVLARRFLLENHDGRRFIPLCAVAYVYDSNRMYHRKIYTDFRLLPRGAQLRVFERCGFYMCDESGSDFVENCFERFRQAVMVVGDKSGFYRMFYDDFKHVRRAMSAFSSECIPHLGDFKYFDRLSDILCVPFRDSEYGVPIIDNVFSGFHFQMISDIEASALASFVMCCISESVGGRSEHRVERVDGFEFCDADELRIEYLETMEDLFLFTLFTSWSELYDVEKFEFKLKDVGE